MKCFYTKIYVCETMAIGELLDCIFEKRNHDGWTHFLMKGSRNTPTTIYNSLDWLQAQNRKTKMYVLNFSDDNVVIKE